MSFFVQFLPLLSGFTNSDVNQYMLEGLPLKVSLLGVSTSIFVTLPNICNLVYK